jgi:hypothetical protein
MWDRVDVFLLCLTIVFCFFAGIAVDVMRGEGYSEITQCELLLPRNQLCVLIAVPEVIK